MQPARRPAAAPAGQAQALQNSQRRRAARCPIPMRHSHHQLSQLILVVHSLFHSFKNYGACSGMEGDLGVKEPLGTRHLGAKMMGIDSEEATRTKARCKQAPVDEGEVARRQPVENAFQAPGAAHARACGAPACWHMLAACWHALHAAPACPSSPFGVSRRCIDQDQVTPCRLSATAMRQSLAHVALLAALCALWARPLAAYTAGAPSAAFAGANAANAGQAQRCCWRRRARNDEHQGGQR